MYKILLSPYSKTFYYDWKINPKSSSYNIVIDQTLGNNINIHRLRVATNNFISQHLLMNSHIKQIDGELYWFKNQYISDLEYRDFYLKEDTLCKYIAAPFNLEQGPLYRLLLFKTSKNKFRFIIVCHHILVDGLSADDIITRLNNCYNDNNYRIKQSLEYQIQKINKLNQQLTNLVDSNLDSYKKYWQNKLSDISAIDLRFLRISNNKSSIESQVSMIKELRFEFARDELLQLNIIARRYLTTPFLFGQIIFGYLLSRYTGQNKFGISYPVAIKEGIDFIYGAHINNIVMPYRFSENDIILDIFKQINSFVKSLKSKDVLSYAYCPVSEMIAISDIRLLDVGFIQTNLKDKYLKFNDVTNIKINRKFNVDSIYKLLFEQEINTTAHIINYRVRYHWLEIDQSLLEGFVKSYKKLFKEVLSDLIKGMTDKKLTEYNILNQADYKTIVNVYNNTETEYPENLTLSSLFEKQAQRTPNNIAVIDAYTGNQYNYKKLLQDTNYLALVIFKTNSSAQLIGIYSEKGYNQVIATLAVMKAGYGYVPLSIDWPIGRIIEVLIKSTIKIVLISKEQYLNPALKIKLKKYQLIVIEDILANKTNTINLKQKKLPRIKPDNIAYVIFTSGSTGKPKGVTITHRGAVNTIYAVNQQFNINENDSVLALSELSFDLSVYDIFGLLAVGGTIVFPEQGLIKDINHWQQLVNKYKISIWNTVPQLASLLIESARNTKLISSLRLFLLSGDYIPVGLPDEIKKSLHAKVISLGGATEGSIWSIWYEIKSSFSGENSVPYGLAMPNQKMYILDMAKKLCPIGAIGEIYIGGSGVALNYYNDNYKTKNSFVEHKEFRRLYKTGDLGRWHPNGYMDFMGRNDLQVKLRGYRIEINEIECILNSYPGIRQSVVIVHEYTNNNSRSINNKLLIGYYVADSKFNEKEIITFLSRSLPEYMLPNLLIYLDRLPLTNNGKLDRSMLPHHKFDDTNNYIAPRNKIERKLCNIFADILGLNILQIGIYADFFRLGGNSILAIKLANRVNYEFNISIDIGLVFQCRNICELARNIDPNDINKIIINKYSSLAPEKYKLSFAQERLWVINKFDAAGSVSYNVPLVFKLNYVCDVSILLAGIKSLIKRHEILRTVFKEDSKGNLYQFAISKDLAIIKKRINSKAMLHRYINENASYIFELDKEFPIKVFNYTYGKEHYLNIVIHHIAFDGWSADIMVRDLLEYYKYNQKLAKGEKATLYLPDLNIQYKDFALWQRTYLAGNVLNSQLTYWKKQLEGHEKLNLPIDKPRPAMFDYQGSVYKFSLDLDLSHELRKTAKELNISLYNLLLSGFYLLISSYSNQNDIILGTVISNRHYAQIENLVGFFVNILVLRSKINYEDTVVDYIKQLSGQLLEAHLYQDLPFERLVEELDMDKDTSRHPLVQVIFGVQHFGIGHDDLFTTYSFVGEKRTSKFDLTLLIDDRNEQLVGMFEYATSLFIEDTIKGYVETYNVILKQLVAIFDEKNVSTKLKDIYYLSSQSYKKVIIDYNHTKIIDFPDKSISQLFEEQVIRAPDNIALIHLDNKLTYKELNEKANQLAYYIKKNTNKFKPNELIALCLNKNERLLISIIAVFKLGAAYVPIDPDFPQERISYILEDTGAKTILANLVYQDKLTQILTKRKKTSQVKAIIIDESTVKAKLTKERSTNLYICINSTNLAYIIYTSGSTGKPKGVIQPHRNLVHLFNSTNTKYKFNSKDVWAMFHSYAFDFSIWEMWGALLYGGKLIIPSNDEIKDLEQFYKLCAKQRLTILNQTPSVFYQSMNMLLNCNKLNSLRYIIFGGESLDTSQLKPWFAKYGYNKPKLINMYGITETTVHVTYHEINKAYVSYKSLIGKAIPGKLLYVLNNYLQPLPIGAIGELYIGGIGLAHGYLNLPEITANRFIPNILRTRKEKLQEKNHFLFKTCDLARFLPDGNLEYIGRNDSQVKIRGYRIETGEIEYIINSYQKIENSKVIALDHTNSHNNHENNRYLVGYYVRKLEIKDKEVRDFIGSWENLYNSTYNNLDIKNFKDNIVGWNSSYTGEAIPISQMLKWRNETVARIKKLKPSRILEIGSGSGLLLFNIINNCQYYYATDFSASAISFTKKVIRHFNYQDKVEAIQCMADKLPFKILENYDTVILNSVAQYFPTINYLEDVLSKVIDNIYSSGQIFIGDVRDYRLMDCFHYSVLRFKNSTTTLEEIEYFKSRDKELLISPEYFIYLQRTNPCISKIELLPKLGSAVNEMNGYRYDIILYINKTPKQTKYKLIDYSKFVKVSNIKEYLQNRDSSDLYIKYPRKMIFKDFLNCMTLYEQKNDLTINEFSKILSLNQLKTEFAKQKYSIKFFLDVLNPLYLNVVGYRDNKIEPLGINYNSLDISKIALSNNPVNYLNTLKDQYNKSLRKYLESNLPSYMIPTYLIRVDQIPLTANGKVDYKALPKPNLVIDNNNYIAPRNKIERKLCEIFAKILGLPNGEFGIKSDFFRIGGNSLLAIKLTDQINNSFNCKLKVTDIFLGKTIEKLAQLTLESKNEFELISHLNNITDKLNLFMIHAGSCGSEVYIPLADKLSNYSCYGVNNYNMYHNEKIESISELSSFYLSAIDAVRNTTDQKDKPYVLLGWSLGGQIATEIAHILEQRGCKEIWVIVLDGAIADADFAYYLSKLEINEEQLDEFLFKQGHLKAYINKVTTNFRCDTKLAQQRTVDSLYYTKILLFKAMQIDSRPFVYNNNLLNDYMIHLKYNSIDKITNLNNIKLVKLDNINHTNIIDQDTLIANNILLWHNT